MRALCFDGGLSLDPDRPQPRPEAGECLVRVRYAGICATDLQIVNGYMNFTGVLGHEMVGTVESEPAVPAVPTVPTVPTKWRGKRVACEINCVCRRCDMCQAGLANHCRDRTVLGILGRDGCFADYFTVPLRNLHQVPDSVSDEQAVFIEPLAAAYQVLQQLPIERRMRVSVLGSGKLGLLVAQVLAATGCKLDVIGRNPTTLVVAEKLRIQPHSVDDVILKQDRDVVVECTGSPAGLELAMQLVRPRGTIVLKTTYAHGGTEARRHEGTEGRSVRALPRKAVAPGDEGTKEAEAINLAPIVVNEVTLLGSRCGPFPEAIAALARKAINIEPMISQVYDLAKGVEAIDAARRPGTLKILLRVDPHR